MIENITLKFTEITSPVVIPSRGVTIFVGPNNSGKSLLLKELEALFGSYGTVETKLVQDFEIVWPTKTQVADDFVRLEKKGPSGIVLENVYIGRFSATGQLEGNQIHRKTFFDQLEAREKRYVASQFLKYFQIRLDGRTRFDLTNDRPTGDLVGVAENVLASLFQDDDLRREIRDIIFDAFKMYFVIDPLMGGTLRIRLSSAPPRNNEQSLDKEAREYHRDALYIKEASDGVQAFVGIMTAILSGDFRSILIDEPEAFLHPPLARKLGYQLTTTAAKRSGTLMASTHSPDFLMGCLQGSNQVRVVRLEYSQGKSKGQVVDSDALRKFFKAPLVRSANVISGLFHDGVVVTESDNDRAFYSEIYYRLAEKESGYPSLLFVNAQNKQTIRDIIGPLRAFGVPAVGIVDIDILKDGGSTWSGWLKAANFPPAMIGSLGVLRGDVLKLFETQKVNMKFDGGVEALPPDDKDAADQLFDTLEQFGVFVTRKGEIESWLPHLGVPGKKADWTVAMLERLGDDSSMAAYVHPAVDDVWEFIRKTVAWIQNPGRKGMASN